MTNTRHSHQPRWPSFGTPNQRRCRKACCRWRYTYQRDLREALRSWPPGAGAALRRNREVLDAIVNL